MTILTINSGSSSLKVSLFDEASGALVLSGSIERIGLAGGRFRVKSEGRVILDEPLDFPNHDSAFHRLFAFLDQRHADRVAIIGHRIVHGGRDYSRPAAVTPKLIDDLRALIPLAPEHLPQEISAIEAAAREYRELPQYACFDTAFHAARPAISRQYPIARELWSEGLIRYGFHGLSYSYILEALAAESSQAAAGRVIVAHLGNGSSMASVLDGRPVDTTMGFTPAGGLMMGTRSGDLDPGVFLYLQEQKKLSAIEIRALINRRSGLLGVSTTTYDMQDLLAKESSDARAAEAIALYCYQAKKYLGALAATLGGLDTLIFTAGIGENSPRIRERICANLEFLGVHLDPARNDRNESVISTPESRATVRVMKTDEDRMIARQASLFPRSHPS